MWLHFDGTIQAKLLCPDVDPLREVRRKHFYRYLWHYVPSPASFCKLIFHSFHNCCKFFTAIKWHRDLNKWPRYLASHPITTGPPNRISLTEKSFSQVVCIWLETSRLFNVSTSCWFGLDHNQCKRQHLLLLLFGSFENLFRWFKTYSQNAQSGCLSDFVLRQIIWNVARSCIRKYCNK